MAFFQYISEIETDCLHSTFKEILEEAGLDVSNEFSNSVQVFAENGLGKNNFSSKVKVFITWSDKTQKCCSIEVRSDEPFLKKNTCCERLAAKLQHLIPPRNQI
tara:strand:+ start:4662 stop:4973 length:312 start_codon:yes stop_codon:yes gene_type:complete